MEDINKIYAQITIDELKEIYKGASKERKEELIEGFLYLETDIRKRVKTYEDALDILNKTHFSETTLYPREIARRKLEVITEALNEGWKADLFNDREHKWYPTFNLEGKSFVPNHVGKTMKYPTSGYGINLYCKSAEIAKYMGSQFLDLYKTMLIG